MSDAMRFPVPPAGVRTVLCTEEEVPVPSGIPPVAHLSDGRVARDERGETAPGHHGFEVS